MTSERRACQARDRVVTVARARLPRGDERQIEHLRPYAKDVRSKGAFANAGWPREGNHAKPMQDSVEAAAMDRVENQ